MFDNDYIFNLIFENYACVLIIYLIIDFIYFQEAIVILVKF